MTYKALHIWSQLNFNPSFPLPTHPTANVCYILSITYHLVLEHALLFYVSFSLPMLVFSLRIFSFSSCFIPTSSASFKPILSQFSKVRFRCSLLYIPLHLVFIAVIAHTIYYKTKTRLVFFHLQGSLWVWLNHICVAFMPMNTWYVVEAHMFYHASCNIEL